MPGVLCFLDGIPAISECDSINQKIIADEVLMKMDFGLNLNSPKKRG